MDRQDTAQDVDDRQAIVDRQRRQDRQEAEDRQAIRDRQRREKQKQQWQLNRVDDMEWTQDQSGVYVYIGWDAQFNRTRLDVMCEAEAEAEALPVPLQSFAGTANNVRKHSIRWLSDNMNHAAEPKRGIGTLSAEHISYIGYELARCDAERIDFVQD